MSHLSTDRLAELADELPTPAESAHLAACAACVGERAAFQTLVAMAYAEREPLGMPLTRWESIAAELALDPVATTVQPRRAAALSSWAPRSLRIAAGLLLVAGGVVIGRVSARGDLVAPPLAMMPQSSAHGDSSFASVEEARLAQQRSEAQFRQAAAYLAQHDTTAPGDGDPVAYRSRLAALDQVISTTRAAMREAPHDPIINGYYLNTLGQREATLRQLNTVLPASLRLNSF